MRRHENRLPGAAISLGAQYANDNIYPLGDDKMEFSQGSQ